MKPADVPLIVAHRGASSEAPENTIPAFERAWEQGADAIEGDFHMTADGEIVCIHDEDTKKTTNVPKLVRSSTLAELRELDVGRWFSEKWEGTLIPTIAEVLATIPQGKKIFIEVKCGPEVIPKLLSELERSPVGSDQVVVISYNPQVISALKSTCCQISAMWITEITVTLLGMHYPTPHQLLEALRAMGADGLSTKANKRISKAFVRNILESGYEFHVWTVDKPSVARTFAEMGAYSITTNRPALLRASWPDTIE